MGKIVKLIKGEAELWAVCPDTAAFINACAEKGIALHRAVRTGKIELRFFAAARDVKRIKALAEAMGCEIRMGRARGLPFAIRRIKKRYALLAGLMVCAGALWASSLFIWEIDVVGNSTVATSKILTALEENGLSIGTFRLSVQTDEIKNDMMLSVDELGWIAVNIDGSRATVIVHERIPAPEVVDGTVPTLVYAEKSGVISEMTVLNGKKLVKVGDTVMAGEVLVTGQMDSISSGTRFVHAMASVKARTWYQISAQMPLKYSIKCYSGQVRKVKSVIIGKKFINFYLNSGNPGVKCDKIEDRKILVLPGGICLPATVVTTAYYPYEVQEAELTVEEAEAQLQERLKKYLLEKLTDGEIREMEFSRDVSNGVVTVTMTAECVEEIAAMRQMTSEELAANENIADTEE